jgi:hypothetical protein
MNHKWQRYTQGWNRHTLKCATCGALQRVSYSAKILYVEYDSGDGNWQNSEPTCKGNHR